MKVEIIRTLRIETTQEEMDAIANAIHHGITSDRMTTPDENIARQLLSEMNRINNSDS